MLSLYNPEAAIDIVQRLNQLQKDTPRQWGKMSAAQMLWHVNSILEIPLGLTNIKPNLIGKLMGPLLKKMVLNPKPYKPNLPTGPEFVAREDKDFEAEKIKVTDNLQQFIHNGPEATEGLRHPLFGKMTAEEWGYSLWKHFDHHLRQFGL